MYVHTESKTTVTIVFTQQFLPISLKMEKVELSVNKWENKVTGITFL